MNIKMENKKCSKCLNIKNLSEFNKAKNKKKGVSSLCKKCHSEYRKKHYLENKSKIIQQVNEYKLNNPEKYLLKKQYINKYQKKNKKAGRVLDGNCFICNNHIYVTKKDIENNVKHYCSKECRFKNKKSNYHFYLTSVKSRAIKKKLEFDLTEEYIKELLEQKQNNICAITNCFITIKPLGLDTTLYDTASLDRIDNSKGYIKDNVQWVMLGINYLKLDFDNDELHQTLKLIKENYIIKGK